jgi:gluconolactonase
MGKMLCLAVILLSTLQTPAGIPGVVAPGAVPELVREGFTFTEGPVGAADGGLFFSDIQGADRTNRLDPSGKVSIFREHTNGANGLALTRNGELLAAEGDGKRISRITTNGEAITLTEGALLAPNDLISDSKGGIYFTDPGPRPVVPGRKVYVYYLPARAKQPVVIDEQIARPNGLTLTNDQKTLIVDDTLGETVYAYDVQSNGKVQNKRVFTKLHDIPAAQESGADGMAIDRDDRIFVSTVTGVQVFDSRGDYLGTIRVPRQPANVAFAGTEKRILYITAREGLYRIQTLTQGPKRLGK